jgi:hypothetical protein
MSDQLDNRVRGFFGKMALRAGYSIRRSDELTALADKFGSDKGNYSIAHNYARIYNQCFSGFRNRRIVFVEIGLHRADFDKRRQQRCGG